MYGCQRWKSAIVVWDHSWCGLLSPWEAVRVGEVETPGDVAVDSAVFFGF
jgi:hypothetical protein